MSLAGALLSRATVTAQHQQNDGIKMFSPKSASVLPAWHFGGSEQQRSQPSPQPPAVPVGGRHRQCSTASPGQGFLLGNGSFWQQDRQEEMQAGQRRCLQV